MNIDFYKDYYDNHIDYIGIRDQESDAFKQYIREVDYWKNKYLASLITGLKINSLCEVGCATGILLSRFPLKVEQKNRLGIDVSQKNIDAAKFNFPDINFYRGTIEEFAGENKKYYDLVILSDILEHVDDDIEMLRNASKISDNVLINLPLEKCEEFKDREYGITDYHGHLKAYDINDAIKLIQDADMDIVNHTVRYYVLEPCFRTYLADKLINNQESEDKINGMIQYINEINKIELNPAYYKSNLFALLKKKTIQNEKS